MTKHRPNDFSNPVQHLVKSGVLPKVRSCHCFVCGEEARHYHHVDYDKPTEVIPVCVKCHRALHVKTKLPGKNAFFRATPELQHDIEQTAVLYKANASELCRMAVEYFVKVKPMVVIQPKPAPTTQQQS